MRYILLKVGRTKLDNGIGNKRGMYDDRSKTISTKSSLHIYIYSGICDCKIPVKTERHWEGEREGGDTGKRRSVNVRYPQGTRGLLSGKRPCVKNGKIHFPLAKKGHVNISLT